MENVNDTSTPRENEAESNVQPLTETSAVPSTAEHILHDAEEPLPVIEEHHEELVSEPLENFSSYSKEQIVKRMEELSESPEFNTVKDKVSQAREVFHHMLSEEKATALSKFLEEGGTKEAFEYHADVLEERFNEALKKYNKRKSEYVLGQEKTRQNNLRTKQDILQQMKNIIQHEEDMSKAFNEFHDLQARWRNVGPVPPQHINDLWMTYRLYIERFYDYIKINRELQDLDQKKNLEMKLQLCEHAEELMLESSLNKAIQEVNQLQLKWKDIGIVPRDKRTEVWTRFKAAIDKVYDRRKVFIEELKVKHADNLEAKKGLIAKAQEILSANEFTRHAQWQDAVKSILEIQQEWKKIGPAEKEANEEIWKEFKAVSDQFFKGKDNFYHKKKQEYASNMQLKTELCMQAEGLKESSDWKNTTEELKRLQQEWKKIGAVGSQDKNDKIWSRFKEACDSFFNHKKTHFAEQDINQEENYTKKIELVEAVEKYTAGENAQETLEQLKTFQRQFTEIGLVPLAKKDELQTRFRKTIQAHFDALKTNSEYRQGFRSRNEQRPVTSTPVPAGQEERFIVGKMSKLKEEVTVLENNIGFFAKSKGANALKTEYEEKIRQTKEEIERLKAKLKELKQDVK